VGQQSCANASFFGSIFVLKKQQGREVHLELSRKESLWDNGVGQMLPFFGSIFVLKNNKGESRSFGIS